MEISIKQGHQAMSIDKMRAVIAEEGHPCVSANAVRTWIERHYGQDGIQHWRRKQPRVSS